MDQKHAAYYTLYQPSSNNCAAVVSYMAGYFKQNNKYFTALKDLCKGDVVFFQNSKGLSHVGLCVDWSDESKTFTTVEGNKDNAVKKCVYNYSDVGGYVAGFGRPRYTDEITRDAAINYALSQVSYTEGANNWNKYAEQLDKVDYFAGCGKKQNLPWCAVFVCAVMYNAYHAQTVTEPTPDKITVTLNPLKRGSQGGQVQTIQALLNGFGFRDENNNKLNIDGIFGKHTESAVKSYQKARGLNISGEVDTATWLRILN